MPGEPVDRAPVTRAAEAADALAAFLTALHRPAPAGAPAGRYHGGPLADRTEGFAGQLDAATEAGLVPGPDAVRAVWEDAAADRFHAAYRPAPDAATPRRARGWAVSKALTRLLVGDAGVHGRPGGKPTWGPPGRAALGHLTATAHR